MTSRNILSHAGFSSMAFSSSPLMSRAFSISIQFHRDFRWGQKHAAHSSVIKLHVKHQFRVFWCVNSGREKILRFNPEISFFYGSNIEYRTEKKGLRHSKSLEWIKYEDNKTCAVVVPPIVFHETRSSRKSRISEIEIAHITRTLIVLHKSRVEGL